MSMNKKETAEMERLREELRIAKALRFTDEVLPDVPIPEPGFGQPLAVGFLFNAYVGTHSTRVEPACSSSTGHSFGGTDKTTTQRGVRLFSTRLMALRACRHEVELQVAKILADIDRQIEAELKKEQA